MSSTLMACGHTANATTGDGQPVCAICVGLTPDAERVVEDRPSLDGRCSQCASCQSIVPSSYALPFFEFRGDGSRTAMESCGNCGYSIHAHESKTMNPKRLSRVCDGFVPRGAMEHDLHYDGCRGWD